MPCFSSDDTYLNDFHLLHKLIFNTYLPYDSCMRMRLRYNRKLGFSSNAHKDNKHMQWFQSPY